MGSGQSAPSSYVYNASEVQIVAIKSISDSKLSQAQFAAILDATNAALVDFCQKWSFPQFSVVAGTGYTEGKFGTIAIINGDTQTLGYHTLNFSNIPVAYVNYAAHLYDNQTLLGYTGDFSGVNPTDVNSYHSFISTTFTHEVFEMIGDPDLVQKGPLGEDIYYKGQDGGTRPIVREVCDPVASLEFPQTDSKGNIVYMADYVYPSWFYDTTDQRPYDFMDRITRGLRVYQVGAGYVTTADTYDVYYSKLTGSEPAPTATSEPTTTEPTATSEPTATDPEPTATSEPNQTEIRPWPSAKPAETTTTRHFRSRWAARPTPMTASNVRSTPWRPHAPIAARASSATAWRTRARSIAATTAPNTRASKGCATA